MLEKKAKHLLTDEDKMVERKDLTIALIRINPTNKIKWAWKNRGVGQKEQVENKKRSTRKQRHNKKRWDAWEKKVP